MAETQIAGRNIGDGSVNHLDLNFSTTPVMAPPSSLTAFVVWDSGTSLTKKVNLADLETYFNTKYPPLTHTHTFASLTAKPTTIAGYGITDAVSTSLSYFIGTTANTLNRASGAQTLTGVTVDGNAPISGSVNYIQNQNVSAQSGNLNISGNGTLGSVLVNNGTNSTNGVRVISDLSASLFTGGIEFLRLNTLGGAKIQPKRDATIGGVGLDFLVTTENANETSGTYASALTILPTKAATFAASVTAQTFIGALNGNAATATKWNGLDISLSTYTSGTIASSLLFNSTNNRVEFGTAAHYQSWLGLGSNAYNSIAYLPLTGGTLSGIIKLTDASYFLGNPVGIRFNDSLSNYNNFIIYENGNTYTRGIASATNFSGPGTGLTGTASGLSIGGNATTATTAYNSSRLYADQAGYAFGSANPYYGALTYNNSVNRWRFQVTPGTPSSIEVAYADASGTLNGQIGTYYKQTSAILALASGGNKWVRVAKTDNPGTGNWHCQIDITNLYNYNGTNPISLYFSGSYRGAYQVLQLSGSAYIISQARIVYPTGADTDYYIEVYLQQANSDNISLNLSNFSNISLITPIDGSIPVGYATKTLIANNQAMTVNNVFATSFNGPGTGLTGMAQGLSIGGNADYATTCNTAAVVVTVNDSLNGLRYMSFADNSFIGSNNGVSKGYVNQLFNANLYTGDFTVPTLVATTIKKAGGTSSQYLMADGSVSTGGTGLKAITFDVPVALNKMGLTAATGFSFPNGVIQTQAVLICTTANNGYSVGDQASFLNGQYPLDAGRTAGQGITIQGVTTGGVVSYAIAEGITLGIKSASLVANNWISVNGTQWNLRFIFYYI